MAKNSIFGKKFHFWLKIDENPFFFEHENLTFAEKRFDMKFVKC